MLTIDETDEVYQAYFKAMIYGGPGAGKTHLALELLTKLGKTGVVDTEKGAAPFRPRFKNPDGSNLGIMETRSAVKIVDEGIPMFLDKGYECLLIDQVSTIWDDSKDGYIVREYEKQSKAWKFIDTNGKIPFQGWSFIKGPYNKMIRQLLSAPMHTIINARGVDDFVVSGSGEPVKVGEKAAAEKNTQFEPPVLFKVEWQKKGDVHMVLCEKDRWGCIQGKVFKNPTINMITPILEKLGKIHGGMPEPEAEFTKEVQAPSITEAQRILITKLASKVEISGELVDKKLAVITREEAARIINLMTLGKHEGIFEEG